MKMAGAGGGTVCAIVSAGRLPCCFIFDHSADDEPYDQQDDREDDDGPQIGSDPRHMIRLPSKVRLC